MEKRFEKFTWTVEEEPTEASLARTFAKYGIEGIEIASVLWQDSRARLDIEQGFIYLKLNFLKYRAESDAFEINELHNFFGSSFLVTVSTYPSRKLAILIDEYARKEFDGEVEAFLYQILDRQVSKCSRMIDYTERDVATLEKNAFERITKEEIRAIARKRKNVTVLKHALHANLSVLESLEKRIATTDPELLQDFSYLIDKAHKSYQEALVLEESVAGLDATIKALFDISNNDVIKRLTIVSFLFIPLNLIAGIFGMNLELVPFPNEFVFVAFFAAVASLAAGGYAYRKYLFD